MKTLREHFKKDSEEMMTYHYLFRIAVLSYDPFRVEGVHVA